MVSIARQRYEGAQASLARLPLNTFNLNVFD